MGAILDSVVFALEFIGAGRNLPSLAIDQGSGDALDLKKFHEAGHDCFIAPIFIATAAGYATAVVATTPCQDRLLEPISSTTGTSLFPPASQATGTVSASSLSKWDHGHR